MEQGPPPPLKPSKLDRVMERIRTKIDPPKSYRDVTSTATTLIPERTPPEATTRKFEMRDESLFLANGLQPIGRKLVAIAGSSNPPEEVDILARIVFPAVSRKTHPKPQEVILLTKKAGDPDSPLVARRVTEGKIITSEKLYPIPDQTSLNLTTRNGRIVLTTDPNKHRGWQEIRLYADHGTPTIRVSEAAHPDTVSWVDQRLEALSKKTMKRVGATALSLGLLRGITMPGGVHDKILDPSHNAYEYVLDNLGSPDDIAPEGNVIDGIPVSKDFVIDTLRKNFEANARVAQVMDDLDRHRYDKIKERALVFRNANRAGLMEKEEMLKFKRRLNEASTAAKAMEVVNEFMRVYGSTATADKATLPDIQKGLYKSSIQYAGNAIIDAFSPLPKSMVKGSALGTNDEKFPHGIRFAFSTEPERVETHGIEAANEDNRYINLKLTGQLDLGIITLTTMNYKDTVLHELIHASQYGKYSNLGEHRSGIRRRLENFAGRALSRPNYVTDYAMHNEEENRAEVGKDVLRGHFAHPDHIGEYESSANFARLSFAADLEEKYPGITAYLITTSNPGLFGETKSGPTFSLNSSPNHESGNRAARRAAAKVKETPTVPQSHQGRTTTEYR